MAICKLVMESSVDGKASKIVRMGRLEKENKGLRLFYREENAEVTLFLQENNVRICRVGDYSLDLPLRQGEMSQGKLGLGGSEGKVEVQTYLATYTFHDGELNLSLHYDLLFGEEAQKMRLHINAKTRGSL